MRTEHLYPNQLTCALVAFVLTLHCDPVFAQSTGINWGAVGISWALSTVTTCLIIGAVFGIRSCLNGTSSAKTSEDFFEDEPPERQDAPRNRDASARDRQRYVPSLDKLTPGLLSVSQQSPYLRAQNDTRTNKKKSETQRTSHHKTGVYVEQWCEDQANRTSVAAALQGLNIEPAQNAEATEERHLPYPVGLDLPNIDTRHNQRTKQQNPPLPNKQQDPPLPNNLPTCEIREETQHPVKSKSENVVRAERNNARKNRDSAGRTDAYQLPDQPFVSDTTQKTADHGKIQDAPQPETKATASASASKSQNLVLQAKNAEELKCSPLRIQKHPHDVQKPADPPHKVSILEFKRAPVASNHAVTPVNYGGKGYIMQKQSTQIDNPAKEESSDDSSSSSSDETEEEEDTEEETEEESSLESLQQKQSVGLLSPKKPSNQFSSPNAKLESHRTPNSLAPAKPVESTPPNPNRTIAPRRSLRHPKPPVQNIVPLPADGVSPPPGLLPLTASSHHQVTKNQRQNLLNQNSKDKTAPVVDEHNGVVRRQKSPKRAKAKGPPPSLDLKVKRSSIGSDVVFFAPELQGTSTPAMKQKSAFVPFSNSMISQDSMDENRGNPPKDINAASSVRGPQTTLNSRNQQFHGLLSNDGLRQLAKVVHFDWHLLAQNLHISSDQRTILAEQFSNVSEDCAFEMLKSWRNQQSGSKADIRSSLCNALVSTNHPEMAELLIQEDMIGSSEKLDGPKLVSVV